MNLADLRLHPRDEQELRWFWGEADGALGLRSMFPQQVQQLQLGGGRRGTHTPVQHEPDGHLIAAATRARMISRSLEAIPSTHVRTLRGVYGPLAAVELELYPVFRELAALVVRTEAAARMHRRSKTTRPLEVWLARQAFQAAKGVAGARQVVTEVRREAEAVLVAASKAYAVTRRTRSTRRAG